jgi:hypothetical protein
MKQELKDKIAIFEDVDLAKITIDFDHEDIIDSRDIESRIVDLEGEFESYMSDLDDAEGDEEIEKAEEDLESWLDEYVDTYVSLMVFRDEAQQYTSEWRYGATIIHDDYFEDYAKQLAEDIGVIERNAPWPIRWIDWNAAIKELQQDFSEITFDGNTYWVQ